jgi:hypothetical protein
MTDDMNDVAILAWLDQEDRFVTETIRQHGCFLQCVLGDRTHPTFTYTVGLFGIGHPELIVFGVDGTQAARALNTFYDRVRANQDLTPGDVVRPWDEPVAFLVEEFRDPAATLVAANRHYRRPPYASVPAYQLTWSVDGFFPGEPGYPLAATVQPRPGTFRPDVD